MKKMYKFLFIVACYALLSTQANSQIVSGNGFLKADYIEAGIRANGAFGTTVAAPENFFYSTNTSFAGKLGFISDVGKDGWTVGSPAYIGDYFLPGTPYEGFSVRINGTNYLNSGSGGEAITGSVTGFSTTDVTQTVIWTGTIGALKIRQEFSVEKTKGFILVKVFLVNTGATSLTNVYYTREVDPDNEVTQGGQYNTNNVIEQQNPNTISTALISAQGLNFSSYLGLGSRDCRAKVAVPNGWPNANGEAIWAGTGMKLSAAGNVTGDNAMSLAFKLGNLAAGDSTALSLAYVLNAADLPEAMDRTDPLFDVKTSTYSSGSTINVCAGQQQNISIVNGDGFTWTWSPATGLSATTGRTVKATLSGPMTYVASGVNTCGTTRSITLTLNPSITTPPDNAGAITGPASIVTGFNATYTVPAITGASGYTWTLPAGATFVSGYNTNSVTVNFGPNASGGTISVKGVNGCGEGAVSSIATTKLAIAAPVSANGSPTANKKPVIKGTTEPNLTVTLYEGSTVIGTATADADGKYEITPTSSFSVGTHTLTIKVTDGTGNTSSSSPALSLQISTGPSKPAAPGLVTGTSPVNENQPALKGTAAANSMVIIYANGVAIDTTTADASGNWAATPDEALADGSYSITITATDEFDNVSPVSNALTLKVDTEVPAKPLITKPGSDPVNDNAPVIEGTAEADSKVDVFIDGVKVATVVVDGLGKWLYPISPALSDNTYKITVTTTDAAGNTSESSDETSLIIDTEIPAKPLITGPADTLLNTNQPVLSGTSEPNSAVIIYLDGVRVDSITTDADGNWNTIVPIILTDGTYEITTKAIDPAGNISDISEKQTLEIDTQIPAKPVAELTSGTSPLKENKPSFNGTAEPNSTINIYVDGVVIGTATTDASGNWTYTLPSALSDGDHIIGITATDAAGNTSVLSEELNITIDTEVPEKPSLPVLSGSSNDNSNNNMPSFSGSAEPNSTISIYVDGVVVGTATADADGKWTYTLPSSLDDGDHTISVIATDAAGNSSIAGETLTITIDTVVPPAPPQPALSGTDNDHSNNNKPTITGTAEANSTVNVYVDGVVVGTATADADGKWTYTLPTSLSDGDHTIETSVTDAAGNTSAIGRGFNVVVDTHAPAKPVAGLTSGTSPLKNNKPAFSGTAEPGSTISIYVDGAVVGTATADASGNWSYTLPAALSDGNHTITTIATDKAGNISAASDAQTVMIDTKAPEAPSSATLSGGTNGYTRTNKPSFSGTAEAGASISIYVDGAVVAAVNADASGNWSYTFPTPLAEGAHSISTVATDAAGNESPNAAAVQFTVDTQAPVPTTLPVLTPTQNERTNDNTPVLSGTAEANSIVTVYNNGTAIGTTVADANGSWSFTPSTALADGISSVTTTVTDAAGNVSTASPALTFTVDTQQPVPTITSTVSAVTGAFVVKVTFNEPIPDFATTGVSLTNGALSGFTKISDTEYSFSVMPVSEGDVSIRVNGNTIADAAGNGNSESNVLTVKTSFNAVVETVFPNPSKGEFKIRFNGIVPLQGTVMLVNVQGQTVYRANISFQGTVLNVNAPGLAQGIYVLLVNTKEYTYKTRISIIR